MKKLLIVEGNLREENQSFSEVGIQTHTQSLQDSLNHYSKDLQYDVVNPSSDKNLENVLDLSLHLHELSNILFAPW